METNFKVGDRVLTHSTPLFTPSGNIPPGGSGFQPNKELVIREICPHDYYNVMFFEKHRNGIYEGNFSLIPEMEELWY